MTPAAVTSMPLRDYQDEAIRALGQLYARGQRRLLVGLPTGTGKTVVFGTLAAKAHAKSAWRVLVLAHRDELIEQAVAKILMIRPDLAMHVGVVKAQRNEWDKDIVVASVQSLHRRRLEQIPRDQFDLVVTDEAHHSAADTYVAILRWLGAAPCLKCEKCGGAGERSAAIGTVGTETCPDCGGSGWQLGVAPTEHEAFSVGVSATLFRADQRNLGDVWQDVAYHRTILEMIAAGHLCDLGGIRVELDLNLDKVKRSRGDYQDGALGEALMDAGAPEHAVEAYREHAEGRKTIVFTPTVALSQAMRDAFVDAGYAAEHVDGTTPIDERRAILRRFHSGETMILSNCAVLTEGFDEPDVACVIMARPTSSKLLYVQCVGRGTRTHPSKRSTRNPDAQWGPGCLVLDLRGNTKKHSLVTIPQLMAEKRADQPAGAGLDPEVIELMEERGLSVVDAIELQDEMVANGTLRATRINLFSQRAGNWIEVDAKTWTLGGTIKAVQEDDQTWRVVVRQRGESARVVAQGLSLEYAQGVAEDQAALLEIGRFVQRDAAWRKRPASDRQRKALWRFGHRTESKQPELLAGEASDLLDAAIAAMDD
jgi:superfamily II DNA or RNA helicase